MFCPKYSPHQHASGFLQWLKKHHPFRAEWLDNNTRPAFHGTTNEWWYLEKIQDLRDYVEPYDFERIVGVRLAALLDSMEENDGA